MLLTIVTRSNVGYMNDKCSLECDASFAIDVAKRMCEVSKDNKYVEIYQGSKLYFGDSRVKPWIKIFKDEEYRVEYQYDVL